MVWGRGGVGGPGEVESGLRRPEPPGLAFRSGAQHSQPASPRASSEEKEPVTRRPAGPAYFMRSRCQAALPSAQASASLRVSTPPRAGARLIPRIPGRGAGPAPAGPG